MTLMVMKWEIGSHDNDYAQGILTVDGQALAEVYVNYQTIGWSATRAAWELCRMPAGGHHGFLEMWSAMEAAEASVREAIAEYQRRGPWQPDLAELTETIAKRNEWLRNTEDS